MRYQPLELHAAGSLEENYSVSLEPALQLRPQILNIGRCDHSIRFTLSCAKRRSEFTDPGNDVCSRFQGERGDVSVALARGGAELAHCPENYHPLPAGTRALEHSDRGPRRARVGIVGIVDERRLAELLPCDAPLRLWQIGS